LHMYRRSRLRWLMGLLVITALFLSVVGYAPADPVQDKKQQAEQIKNEVLAIDSRMEIVVEQYNLAVLRMEQNREAIEHNEADIATMQQKIRDRQAILGARLREMYMNGNTDVLEVLTDCKSVDDLISNASLARRISEYDVDIIKSVSASRDELASANQDLEASKAELQNSLDEVASQKAGIESELARRKQLLAGVESEVNALIAQDQARQAAQPRANVPSSNRSLPNYSAPPPNPNAPEVVRIAYAQLNKPYVYAGSGPNVFDCSGLVMYCYAQVGISLPHSSYAQINCGSRVEYADLQPGDLVFFHGFGHVGMYIGDGQYIHAPQTGDVVKISNLGVRRDFCGACRPR
jgi:cell wall-associated NlpC family hydrolase